ncbi:MAG: aspartyl/glutamyl-tRNA amidotransferase subunit C [Gammaproteobacteria bacterium]|nr:aspartyl/glutamyl-tRNA amidotransferase subunit C [Gammaproteobacteria bacterium]
MNRPHETEPGVTVTIQEIHRIAALARVRLDRGEAKRMARDMSSILEHMAVLSGVAPEPAPTSGVPQDEGSTRPFGEASDRSGPPAGEGATTPDPLERPLARIAPDWRDGLFIVPRLPGVAGAPGERKSSP